MNFEDLMVIQMLQKLIIDLAGVRPSEAPTGSWTMIGATNTRD